MARWRRSSDSLPAAITPELSSASEGSGHGGVHRRESHPSPGQRPRAPSRVPGYPADASLLAVPDPISLFILSYPPFSPRGRRHSRPIWALLKSPALPAPCTRPWPPSRLSRLSSLVSSSCAGLSASCPSIGLAEPAPPDDAALDAVCHLGGIHRSSCCFGGRSPSLSSPPPLFPTQRHLLFPS